MAQQQETKYYMEPYSLTLHSKFQIKFYLLLQQNGNTIDMT